MSNWDSLVVCRMFRSALKQTLKSYTLNGLYFGDLLFFSSVNYCYQVCLHCIIVQLNLSRCNNLSCHADMFSIIYQRRLTYSMCVTIRSCRAADWFPLRHSHFRYGGYRWFIKRVKTSWQVCAQPALTLNKLRISSHSVYLCITYSAYKGQLVT